MTSTEIRGHLARVLAFSSRTALTQVPRQPPCHTIRPVDTPSLESFITRWQKSDGAERANYGLFVSDFCKLLGVPRPDPAQSDDTQNAYVFARSVTFQHGHGTSSIGFLDLSHRLRRGLDRKNAPSVSSQNRSSAGVLSPLIARPPRRQSAKSRPQ
jgi:hypothetical protein